MIQQGNMGANVAVASTINVTDKDAFLTSGGRCAFNVKYDAMSGSVASGTVNRLFSNDTPIAVNSNLSYTAGETKTIWTQPYLSAGNNNVRVVVNADGAAPSTKWLRVNVAGTCGAQPTPPPPPVPATFKVIVTAGAGGTVALNPSMASYAKGTQVTATATPNPGFALSAWSGACSGTANPCTVTVNGDTTVSAAFSPVPTYKLTAAPSPGGAIALSPAAASYAKGTQVKATATPNPGFAFSSWAGACTGTANPCMVTVNANANVVALFKPANSGPKTGSGDNNSATGPYKLTLTPSVGGTISLIPAAASYVKGTQVKVTATPNSGAVLMGWTGGACTGATNPSTVTVNADTTIGATFGPGSFKLITSIGVPEGGTLSISPQMASYPYGTQVTVTPVLSSDAYYFTGFDPGYVKLQGYPPSCSNPQGPCKLTITGDTLVRANFVRLNKLTATSSNPSWGVVAVNPNKSWMMLGSEAMVTATALPGYRFTGWTGACSGTVNPCKVVMSNLTNNDASVTANFAAATAPAAPAAHK